MLIRLLINEQGEVDTYQILESEPTGSFDASVVAAFSTAKFAPGLITGYAVKSQLLAEVFFQPGQAPTPNFSIMEPEPSSRR